MSGGSSKRPPGSATERGRSLWEPARLKTKAGLVGLSSAAILSVYAVGYFNTSAANSPVDVANLDAVLAAPTQMAPTATPNTVIIPGTTGATSSPGGVRPSATTGATAPVAPTTAPVAPTATPKAQPTPTVAASGLRDGSYTGVGTSRHGNIGVTVVVANGKIVSADIVSCQTRYPCSRVASLPGQVISKQSANVNYVSGATDSSKAFKGAVAQALSQAMA